MRDQRRPRPRRSGKSEEENYGGLAWLAPG